MARFGGLNDESFSYITKKSNLSRILRTGFQSDLHRPTMAPMIDDDDSDDEVPLAVRAGVNKESGTPKGTNPEPGGTRRAVIPLTLFKLSVRMTDRRDPRDHR